MVVKENNITLSGVGKTGRQRSISRSLPARPSRGVTLAYLLDFAGAVVGAVPDLELVCVDGVVAVARVDAVHVLVAHQGGRLAREEQDDDGAGRQPRAPPRRMRRRRREAEAAGLPRRASPAGPARHASGSRRPGGLLMGLEGRKADPIISTHCIIFMVILNYQCVKLIPLGISGYFPNKKAEWSGMSLTGGR